MPHPPALVSRRSCRPPRPGGQRQWPPQTCPLQPGASPEPGGKQEWGWRVAGLPETLPTPAAHPGPFGGIRLPVSTQHIRRTQAHRPCRLASAASPGPPKPWPRRGTGANTGHSPVQPHGLCHAHVLLTSVSHSGISVRENTCFRKKKQQQAPRANRGGPRVPQRGVPLAGEAAGLREGRGGSSGLGEGGRKGRVAQQANPQPRCLDLADTLREQRGPHPALSPSGRGPPALRPLRWMDAASPAAPTRVT